MVDEMTRVSPVATALQDLKSTLEQIIANSQADTEQQIGALTAAISAMRDDISRAAMLSEERTLALKAEIEGRLQDIERRIAEARPKAKKIEYDKDGRPIRIVEA